MTHPKAAEVTAALTEAGVSADMAAYIDPAKLVDEAGEVDTDKVTAAATPFTQPAIWPDTGGGRPRGLPLGPASDADAGRAEAQKRFGTSPSERRSEEARRRFGSDAA